MVPTVHILIPAAGASSRMQGRDKLLEPVGRGTLLRHVVEVALATTAPVVVALPPGADSRRSALADLAARLVEVTDAGLGMAHSMIGGLAAIRTEAGPEDGLLVLPADMPEFTAPALADLISRFRAEPELIFRGGTVDGQPGHPVIFPRDLWPELERLAGDEGGRSVLQRHRDRVRVIPLPGPMSILDLDTPADWAAWRAGGT